MIANGHVCCADISIYASQIREEYRMSHFLFISNQSQTVCLGRTVGTMRRNALPGCGYRETFAYWSGSEKISADIQVSENSRPLPAYSGNFGIACFWVGGRKGVTYESNYQ